LVAFVSDDVEELHEIFSDPQTHTIGSGPFCDIQQIRARITRRLISHRDLGLCWYALRGRTTRRLIGNCGVFAGRTGVTEPDCSCC
jgi:RimJ/RimL family protein N-acetyltransferase